MATRPATPLRARNAMSQAGSGSGLLRAFCCSAAALLVASTLGALATADESGWKRHTIDDSSRGADGARLLDVNGDGWLDVATGWEEGGKIRAYLNPGPKQARRKWPAVTVGEVRSPEDAVFVDLDGDGAYDVVSSCEGRTRTLFVHWAPAARDRRAWLDPARWRTAAFPTSVQRTSWMFCLPLEIDGQNGLDLVAGSKAGGAEIGWLQAPKNARDLDQWRWRRLYQAGWIMSLMAQDMDGDGDLDIVASDRKGANRGCLWLENPGAKRAAETWPEHRIGGDGKQVMFLDLSDLDGDGLGDVLTAVSGGDILYLRRLAADGRRWETHAIAQPANTGTGKSVRAGDIDLDGKSDLVLSCEKADDAKSGVVWMSYRNDPTDRDWTRHEISGPEGVKFDLLQLLDLDGDGDLDVMTCEERRNLGVIWYENPAR